MEKKRNSRIILLIALVMSIAVFTGCVKSQEADSSEKDVDQAVAEKQVETLKIKGATPVGSPTLSVIKMFKENPSLGDCVEASYECVKSSELMASKVMSGEVDIAIVPSNLAIRLYNKEIDYKYAATGVWGVLYIISDEKISSWEDLKGREINMLGRGLTPDIVTRFLLEANGLEPGKDVTFNYVNGTPDLAQLFIAGENTISIMPEPMVSKVMMKKPDTKIAFDLQKEWANATGGEESYPQAGMIIKNELIENYPEVVEEILRRYEESVKWVNENPTIAGEYSEEMKTGLNAKIVEMAITRSNIMYKNAEESREALESYYKVLFEHSPEIIGGKMPDDDFYYQGR